MIGEEIRRRRQEKGWTGVQLAEKAGMAPSAVSQIETGKRSPHSSSVIKLAAALECEVAELYPKASQAPLPLEEMPTFTREDIPEEQRARFDELLRGERTSFSYIEDTDETITIRINFVRLLEENDQLLQKVRELEHKLKEAKSAG